MVEERLIGAVHLEGFVSLRGESQAGVGGMHEARQRGGGLWLASLNLAEVHHRSAGCDGSKVDFVPFRYVLHVKYRLPILHFPKQIHFP